MTKRELSIGANGNLVPREELHRDLVAFAASLGMAEVTNSDVGTVLPASCDHSNGWTAALAAIIERNGRLLTGSGRPASAMRGSGTSPAAGAPMTRAPVPNTLYNGDNLDVRDGDRYLRGIGSLCRWPE